MHAKRWTPILILMVILSAQIPREAAAEPVSHHGSQVEANGSVKDCASCHDGSAGKMIPVCTAQCSISTEHSVMRPYPPHQKTADYAPVGVVRASGLRIVQGKVTCITCHDLRKKNKYHLVITDQAKLCKTCHLRQ